MSGDREQVLRGLIAQYEGELKTAWVTPITAHRLRALCSSLASARAELGALVISTAAALDASLASRGAP